MILNTEINDKNKIFIDGQLVGELKGLKFLIEVTPKTLDTDIKSIKRDDVSNSITINFPTSLLENPVLIEVTDEIDSLECEYFVQIGAYGNKKYAIEAENMLSNQIPNISITEVYSSLQPDKLLNSVISGPYKNKSAANNAKEKITIEGFEPTLRTRCEQK